MGAYSVAEVKAQFSGILAAVERGENVLITKRGKPVARITRETQSDTAIDWVAIDAFRDKLHKSKASVTALRKHARY